MRKFKPYDFIVCEGADGEKEYIKYGIPEHILKRTAAGKYTHNDQKAVFLFGTNRNGLNIDTNEAKAVMTAFFPQAAALLNHYHQGRYDENYRFTVESAVPVEINGFGMCKYTGKVSSTREQQEETHSYVAYAIQSKVNGVYAYLMVVDWSAEGNYGLIEHYADDLARSISNGYRTKESQ